MIMQDYHLSSPGSKLMYQVKKKQGSVLSPFQQIGYNQSTISVIIYGPYKATWRIPKWTLKTCTVKVLMV